MKNLVTIKKLLVCLFLFSFFFGTYVVAQTEYNETPKVIDWIKTIGAWWLFFFVIGIALIFIGLIFGKLSHKIRKWVSILGLVFLFIGIFGAQIVFLVPYIAGTFGGAKPYATMCEKVGESDIVSMFSCIFSGYAPANQQLPTIAMFVIFGIIAPLGILISLMYEFTDFLTNSGVRSVVTILSAIIAFRVLLASLFIELLNYGFAGIGLLVINYFFFMVIFNFMKKMWLGAAAIQAIITYTDMERIADLTKKLRDVESTLSTLTPGTPEYNAYKKMEENIKRELEELKKKAHVAPPQGIS